MEKYSWTKSKRERFIKTQITKAKKFRWRYGNLLMIGIGIVVTVILIGNPIIFEIISAIESVGYLGSFILGILLPYGITTAPAVASFFFLGKTLNPLLVAVIGSLGSLVSDYLIFNFIKNNLLDKIEAVTQKLKIRMNLVRLRIERSKYLKKIIPFSAGLVIASPLPTELAIGIFAAIKYDMRKFLLYALPFHFISILIITQVGSYFLKL